MSTTQILCFKAIISFITDLHTAFGELNRPIKLYYKILEQVTFTHHRALNKNNELFGAFILENQEGILEQDLNLFTNMIIQYSDKAFVDLKYVFESATPDQAKCVWKHLLTIMAITQPTSRARSVLLGLQDTREANVINNIVSKIEEHVEVSDTTNPMEAVTQIIQSGVFADMVKDLSESMQRGDVSIEKLMSTIGGGSLLN